MSLENELKLLPVEKNKWYKLGLYFKVTDETVFIDELCITKEENDRELQEVIVDKSKMETIEKGAKLRKNK